MAFYRKKRRKAGPSKNDEKVRRGQTAEDQERAAGTLSTRFPSVRSLRVKLSISTAQGVVLEESEETYGPNDAFVLEADCPGSCSSGSYDFAVLIAQSLERLEKRGSTQAVCAEASYNGGPGGVCGCVAKCDFNAEVAVS